MNTNINTENENTTIDIKKLSPMMAEYVKTKQQYKDCILFYRLGDFYEMFFEDALTVKMCIRDSLSGDRISEMRKHSRRGRGSRVSVCGKRR